MKNIASLFAMSCLALVLAGCSPSGNAEICGQSKSKATFCGSVKFPVASVQDAVSTVQQQSVALYDMDFSTFAVDRSFTPLAQVTINTDTGRTYTNTFDLSQIDATSYQTSDPTLQTVAFAVLDQAGLSSWVQSVAANANSSVAVQIQNTVGFQGPVTGGSSPFVQRSFHPALGGVTLASGTVSVPDTSGDPGSGGAPPDGGGTVVRPRR